MVPLISVRYLQVLPYNFTTHSFILRTSKMLLKFNVFTFFKFVLTLLLFLPSALLKLWGNNLYSSIYFVWTFTADNTVSLCLAIDNRDLFVCYSYICTNIVRVHSEIEITFMIKKTILDPCLYILPSDRST